jgi:hypothetical protein
MGRYLGSKQINDRTDDDKTLILASRRPAPKETTDAGSDQNETRSAVNGKNYYSYQSVVGSRFPAPAFRPTIGSFLFMAVAVAWGPWSSALSRAERAPARSR